MLEKGATVCMRFCEMKRFRTVALIEEYFRVVTSNKEKAQPRFVRQGPSRREPQVDGG
jgi:hypothetical protein